MRTPPHTPQRLLRIVILKSTHTCQLGSLLSPSCKFLPPNSEYFREEGRFRRLRPEVLNTCPDTLGKMWQFSLVRIRTKVDGHNPRLWEAEAGETEQVQSQFVSQRKLWATQ